MQALKCKKCKNNLTRNPKMQSKYKRVNLKNQRKNQRQKEMNRLEKDKKKT